MRIIQKSTFKYVVFFTKVVIIWMLVSSLLMIAVTYNKKLMENDQLQPTDIKGVLRRQNYSPMFTTYVTYNRTMEIMNKNNNNNNNLTLLPMLQFGFESFTDAESAEMEERTLLYGTKRTNKAFMVIGIPTVSRRKGTPFYLDLTLDHLIKNTNEGDQKNIIVVIFMADFNKTWNLNTAADIYNKYKPYCESGFIVIIQSPLNIYPDFSNVKLTLKDPFERVMWRSKQNIDFSFLMLYSRSLSDYYLQLEDDVITAQDYVSDIQSLILLQSKPWVCLEYSNLGFIGKLFHANHLNRIAKFLLASFNLQPCDILLGRIRTILGQGKSIHSNYSLFQHIGKVSSLNNKMMPSIDNKYKHIGEGVLMVSRIPKGDNPHARIVTNMQAIDNTMPEFPYFNNTYFKVRAPTRKSYYRVVYDKPYNISQIVISTGDDKFRNNVLRQGEIRIAKSEVVCSHHKGTVGLFVDGEIDTAIQGIILPKNVRCFEILVKKTQKDIAFIRTISVILDKS